MEVLPPNSQKRSISHADVAVGGIAPFFHSGIMIEMSLGTYPVYTCHAREYSDTGSFIDHEALLHFSLTSALCLIHLKIPFLRTTIIWAHIVQIGSLSIYPPFEHE